MTAGRSPFAASIALALAAVLMTGCDPDDGAGGDLAGTWELMDFRITRVSTTDSFPVTVDSRLRDDDVVLELTTTGPAGGRAWPS